MAAGTGWRDRDVFSRWSASLHSFPPCLLYQQRGVLFIVPVKKYRLLFIRFITGIFGRGICTLTVRVYRCGPLHTNYQMEHFEIFFLFYLPSFYLTVPKNVLHHFAMAKLATSSMLHTTTIVVVSRIRVKVNPWHCVKLDERACM